MDKAISPTNELTRQDVEQAGFKVVMRNMHTDYPVETQDFVNDNYEPKTRVEIAEYSVWIDDQIVKGTRKTGFIGRLQWPLKSKEDFEKFLTKSIPTFCELK